MTKNIFRALILTMMGIIAPSLSLASSAGNPTILPGSTQVGQPATGSDMWTQTMTQLGLFRAHRDDCDTATEVFVETYTDDNSVQFGYCIEKDERAALEWEDARQTCLDNEMRLPEPAEFKFACQIGTGLSNMTNGLEWASNFYFYAWKPTSGYQQNLAAYTMGNGSCKYAVAAPIARSDSISGSYAFRCVR